MTRLSLVLAALLPLASLPLAACGPAGPTEFAPAFAPPGPGDPDWDAEFRGIDLSAEQVNRIRELKAVLDARAFGGGFDPRDLIAMAERPGGDAEFGRGPIAAAIRDYNAGVAQVLSPAQLAQWRRNGGGA